MTKSSKHMLVIFAVVLAFAVGTLVGPSFMQPTVFSSPALDPDTNIFPADGNVGIGTLSPEKQLHLKGITPGEGQLLFENTSPDGSAALLMRSDTGALLKAPQTSGRGTCAGPRSRSPRPAPKYAATEMRTATARSTKRRWCATARPKSATA